MKLPMTGMLAELPCLLMAGYPLLEPYRTLYELENHHPEKKLQAVLDQTAQSFALPPLVVAHLWFYGLYGEERLSAARRAYDQRGLWDETDRFILRRLSLAVLRGRQGGAGLTYSFSHVDDFVLGILITYDELEAHIAKLQGLALH